MNAPDILTVGTAVATLTQLVKWSGLPSRLAPLAVAVLSFIGVAFWGWSTETFSRATAFEYFAGWVTVATTAAGVFGFVRESAEGVMAMRKNGSGPLVALLALTLGFGLVGCGGSLRHVAVTADVAYSRAVFAIDDAALKACDTHALSQPRCDDLNPLVLRALEHVRAVTIALQEAKGDGQLPATLPDLISDLVHAQRVLAPFRGDAALVNLVTATDDALDRAVALLRTFAGGAQ